MIRKATIQDANVLTEVGLETFYNSHKNSAPQHELDTYMKKIYTVEAITRELDNPENIYHLIHQDGRVAGFSKMELSIKHPLIDLADVSKMDQIYLLDEFQGLKLGAKLLSFNIVYSKANNQNGMWLVVWIGNSTAITFYEKFGFSVVSEANFQLTDNHLSPCYIMLLKY